MAGQTGCYIVKSLQMDLYRVPVRQKHRIIPPEDPFRADDLFKLEQRPDAFINGRHARFDVFPVGRDRILKMSMEPS